MNFTTDAETSPRIAARNGSVEPLSPVFGLLASGVELSGMVAVGVLGVDGVVGVPLCGVVLSSIVAAFA